MIVLKNKALLGDGVNFMLKKIAKKIPQLNKIVDERNRYALDSEKKYEKILELERINADLVSRIASDRSLKDDLLKQNEIVNWKCKAKRFENQISSYLDGDGSIIDHSFIRLAEDQHVVAFIPVELLFTEDKITAYSKVDQITADWKHQNTVWENINLVRLKPHRDLMNFFKGLEKSPDAYIKWFENLFSSRGLIAESSIAVIDRRHREFQCMSKELNKGIDFFTDNPIEVRWNPSGYFNIIDGHHRAMFLYCSGMRLIPAKVSVQEFINWINKEKALECLELINDQVRSEFYTPICNPYFYDRPAYRDNSYKSRLDHILEFFNSKRFSNYKILDIGSNLGYYSQFFSREGAKVTALEPDKQHYDLAKLLTELTHTNITLLQDKIEEYETSETYDVAIFLTVFYHFFEDKRELIIKNLDKLITSFIIWESGDNPQMEIDYITQNSKFTYYKQIGDTYGTDKIRELGIFSVSPF
ncbi:MULTISPECIES: class I SAM-dependent methyltransferase [unclassified Paenibacillus]|uniref:class I SAM-dependent methyltransferase n=1 Tax=unclassified Paenibacillus TaxID=185978 RepID=UPI00383919B2